jgi:flavin reductase (DIM6/NTAB) family NADH-FMN oxidoreductase RutF
MPVDGAEFRRILGHWASGVAIIATLDEHGMPAGLTANAVASVSLNPPLALACVELSSNTHDLIRDRGFFTINVLAQGDERVARQLALDDADKFRGIAWHAAPSGAPLLDNALAWLDCTVHAQYDGGDHTIFVGLVMAGSAREAEPLAYYRGGYHRLGT